jgi:putative transposase
LAGIDDAGERVRRFEVADGCVAQAYRFALDPTRDQDSALRSHCGAARVAYNWAVARVLAVWGQRAAEESYGIPEEQRTPWRTWNLFAMRKEFNEAKHADPRFADWWAQNSKEAYNTGLANAASAFDNYAASKRGTRVGRAMGVPRFKSKRSAALSCKFATGAIRVEADRQHVTLPRLGAIKTFESTRKLERRIANGTARILSATISHARGRWFVSFQVEVERAATTPAGPDAAVGVDLGIKHLAVIADSDGSTRFVPNPGHLNAAQATLRRHGRRVCRRQGPDRRTGQSPSSRWLKANAERNRVHHRVANLREDALHKLTTSLAAEYGHVVVEDLNVAGMVKNRRLARKIADAGFGTIRRHLAYKTTWNGGALHVADRWFPSSKTCSACGAVKAKLPLRVRVFHCDGCGLVLDRDENAARNLMKLALQHTGSAVGADPGVRAPKPRRADHKTRTARAGGEKPHPGKETRDRHQGTPQFAAV